MKHLLGTSRTLKLFIFLFLSSSLLVAEHNAVPDWMRQAAAESVTFDKDAKAAVLLDDQSITVLSNGEIETSLHRVVKILRPQGREYAHVRASFDKNHQLRSIRAWSMSAKGEEYELKAKDFSETGYSEELYSDVHLKYAQVPAADPGTVIGLEIQYKSRPYTPEEVWEFQEDIPVHLARYSAQLPQGWEYKSSFFRHSSMDPRPAGANGFVWELRGI